jgi:hypothetical protein
LGIFFLYAGPQKKVIINGTDEISNGQKWALTSTTTGIECGDLTYTLIFINPSMTVYSDQRSHQQHATLGSPLSLSATPTSSQYQIQGYAVYPVSRRGSTCTVALGIRQRDGEQVAVKKITRTRLNAHIVRQEISVMEKLGQHVSNSYSLFPNSSDLSLPSRAYVLCVNSNSAVGTKMDQPMRLTRFIYSFGLSLRSGSGTSSGRIFRIASVRSSSNNAVKGPNICTAWV